MKYFSLLYQKEIHSSGKKKVIPSKEFQKLLSGLEVVKEAKKEAEVQNELLKKKGEELFKESEEKGFLEGLEKFNLHILELDQEMRELRFEMQKLILPLALQAAKKIVGKELELHPETIVDIVLQALKPATQSRRVMIWVNKEHKEMLDTHKDKLKEVLEHADRLMIQEREDIAPGGCLIETEAGIINASLENQWRALQSAFETFMK